MMKRKTLEKLITEVQCIARTEFGGHFTILGFTTNYKGCFGTIELYPGGNGYAQGMYLPAFRTLDELLQWMIDEKFSVYDIPDLPPFDKIGMSKAWG